MTNKSAAVKQFSDSTSALVRAQQALAENRHFLNHMGALFLGSFAQMPAGSTLEKLLAETKATEDEIQNVLRQLVAKGAL
jgi:hypothetical protein